MKGKDANAAKDQAFSSTFSSERRDFIKACGATAAGGLATFLLPGASNARDSLSILKAPASQAMDEELFWSLVRSQFVLKPGLTYMNTGTEGSMPRPVLSRIKGYFKEFARDPHAAVVGDPVLGYFMTETCQKVADFVGATPDEILMTTNTTEGMSFVANGLELTEGDEVLTTLHEHGGGLSCWHILRDRRGVAVTELALPTPAQSKDEIVSIFESAITPQTKVMSFCHINYTTGLRMPVKELCQLARDHEIISVVDGAHAIGMLDLNISDLGCDFYACSPHKWLNAPPGTGVLYLRGESQSLLWPTVTEAYSGFLKDYPRVMMQGRGQQCTPAYACVCDAVDFQNTIGKEKIESRILALSGYLKDKIAAAWGADSIFSPMDDELSTGLTSFNPFDDVFDGDKTGTVSGALQDEYNIVIRTTSFRDNESDRKDTRALRVSTHIFNNYRQIDELVSAIQSIMAGM